MDDQLVLKTYRGLSSAIGALLIKLIVPVLIGFLAWLSSYPLQYYNCYTYAEGKHFSKENWDFVWFTCYINNNGKWYTQREYQSSVVGAKLIIAGDSSRVEELAKPSGGK